MLLDFLFKGLQFFGQEQKLLVFALVEGGCWQGGGHRGGEDGIGDDRRGLGDEYGGLS